MRLDPRRIMIGLALVGATAALGGCSYSYYGTAGHGYGRSTYSIGHGHHGGHKHGGHRGHGGHHGGGHHRGGRHCDW